MDKAPTGHPRARAVRRGALRAGVGAALLLVGATAHAGGLLRVTSGEATGRVFIDGVDTGQSTPATFDDVPVGRHSVQVEGNCARGSTSVTVAATGLTKAEVELASAGGTLVVLPTPADAQISIDGAPASARANNPVACGNHTVNVTLDEHLPAVLTVQVGMDDVVELPVTLVEQGKGTLAVTISPEEARVILDGVYIATGSVSAREVVAGPHVLRVEAHGYQPAERQFQLENGATRQIILALDRGAPAARAGRGGRIAGWGLTAAGLGALGFAGWQGLQTAAAYRDYEDDVSDGDFADQDEADDAYEDRITPMKSVLYGSLGAGGALLASGVTLVLVF